MNEISFKNIDQNNLWLFDQYYLTVETIIMGTENSKTSVSNKCFYKFTDRLNYKNWNKNIALANLSIYYTWKNIKSTYSNNKINRSAATRTDEFH